MKTPFNLNLQLFAEPGVNFEDILKKHAGEDGNIPADAITDILTSKDRQRTGFTAPPQGLTLIGAEY
jgi:hypothetical protein